MPEEYSGGMDKTARGGEEAQRQGGRQRDGVRSHR